ncbi:MAG: methyltransferase domain-containing protein [Proteobacteria bacterium]|nr:methyltransferase domain-containing protein [Pseudomonadota bacterium]
MSDEIKNSARKISWIKQRGYRLLDLVVVLLVCFFATIAWQLVQRPDPLNLVLLCVVGYVAGRIIYELAFNRTQVPTLLSGFFERRKIIELLKKDAEARGGASYTMIDLGSGRGELTRQIARALPQARVIGLEIVPFAYLQSRFFQRLFGLKNLEYQKRDFLSYDCSAADAVMLYLNARLAQEVGEKLCRELKPGALVISNSFPLKGAWQPAEIIAVHSPFKVELFVYRR